MNITFDKIVSNVIKDYTDDEYLLYAKLIGSWSIKSTWYDQGGINQSKNGEWYFSWILGGNGIQDVLYALESPKDKYGTSLRCYDHENKIWHITWMQPGVNAYTNLTGKVENNEIINNVQGLTEKKEIWKFKDITPRSFVWQAVVSTDNGKNWFVQQEMIGTRME